MDVPRVSSTRIISEAIRLTAAASDSITLLHVFIQPYFAVLTMILERDFLLRKDALFVTVYCILFL